MQRSHRCCTPITHLLGPSRTLLSARAALPSLYALTPTSTPSRPSRLLAIRTMASAPSVPEKMKCILIKDGKGPAENMYMGEEAVPKPKEGEALVKVGEGVHQLERARADIVRAQH